MATAARAPAFFINNVRKNSLHLEGKSRTRFAGWKVALSSVQPYHDPSGRPVLGLGSLRCPRGDVLRMPLREAPTEDNAARLAAAVANMFDVEAGP